MDVEGKAKAFDGILDILAGFPKDLVSNKRGILVFERVLGYKGLRVNVYTATMRSADSDVPSFSANSARLYTFCMVETGWGSQLQDEDAIARALHLRGQYDAEAKFFTDENGKRWKCVPEEV